MRREPIITPISGDSLEAYLGRHTGGGHTVYIVVVILVLSAIALLPLVRVSVTVGGRGVLRPLTEKHEVRARTSGVAAQVVVSRGDTVRAGQPLITLRAETVEARARLIARQIGELVSVRDDIEWLTRGAPELVPTGRLRSARVR